MGDWKVIDEHGRLAPVLVQLIVLGAFIGGTIFGYWIRMQLETRAELSVVLDDEKAVQTIEQETEAALKAHGSAMEGVRDAEVDECYTKPLPAEWFDFVQSGVSEEEQLFGD